MKYRVISPRVGTPGEIYNPPAFVNVGILLANGFIEQVDPAHEPEQNPPTEDPKPAKTKKQKAPQE